MKSMRPLALLVIVMLIAASEAVSQGKEPRVLEIDTAGFRSILREAKGNPLLVNFWATWCVPCVQEFPDLVRLRETYGPRGLNVVFVSIDRPADVNTVVRRFLRSHGVRFTTYIKGAGNDEGFINAVHHDWSGAIPATFVFDAGGTLKHMLIDQQTFDTLSNLVKPLLRH